MKEALFSDLHGRKMTYTLTDIYISEIKLLRIILSRLMGLGRKRIMRSLERLMANDDNEIMVLSCDKCKESNEGTYKELFGDLPSLRLLSKLVCKCGGDIALGITGRYKGKTKC